MQLTLERIFSEPDLNGAAPNTVKFSPDASRLTFLKSKAGDLDSLHLFEYHIADKTSRILVDADNLKVQDRILSEEEKANRERKRIRNTGIVEYHWAPDGSRLLFPLDGNLYLYQLQDQSLIQLTDDSTFETDIRFSPNGQHLAFIRDRELWCINLEDRKEKRLTFDASDVISNGLAEFIAQEEMHRFNGYWWSPDSRYIAFAKVDETPVNLSQRYEIDADNFNVIDQRYPYTGTNNADVSLWLCDVQSGDCAQLSLDRPEDSYLARIDWLSRSVLTVQIQNREQNQLDLLAVEIPSGNARQLIHESSDTWINLHDEFRPLEGGNEFIWCSEKSGFKHLSRYDAHGNHLNDITAGEWMVSAIKTVAEGEVFFTGFADDVLEQHLYVAPVDGSREPSRLTQAGHYHGAVVAADGQTFIDQFNSIHAPTQTLLRSKDGETLCDISNNALTESHPFYAFRQSTRDIEFGELTASDGQTLHYRLIPPTERSADTRYPVIVTVYGGPHAQLVTRQWISPWHHYMAQRGYGLMQLDNRGSANRGVRFESAIHLELGNVEVEDQLTGVEYLKSLPWVDDKRLGVFGHSYGGFMTLMMMLKAPDTFKAGVSVAPVIDWALYDTHYTERYLGMPADNESGYEKSSVFPYLQNLKGDLLLIHGMADDNVLFLNSTKLYKALQDLNIPFDSMAYPGAKHGLIGKSVNLHRYGTMDRFFDRSLKA